MSSVDQKSQPILKWVGGKRQLLHEIYKYIPKKFNRYFEPFVGGGALFFSLYPQYSRITDLNPELINTYKVIKDKPSELITTLVQYPNTKEFFLEIRALDRNPALYNTISDVGRAARFIYLNKTAYNGLYRVNQKGQCNAPYGYYTKPNICNEERIYAASRALQSTDIECESFECCIKYTNYGDFVYFDPPYQPLNTTANFTNYTSLGFTEQDQIRLRDLCNILHTQGVKWLVSNSDTPFIRQLYGGYKTHTVLAKRSINSKGDKRGEITELLIHN